jgi:hypothetical protein
MPIPRDHFEQPEIRKTERELIIEFLYSHKNNAYTSDEIFTAIYPNHDPHIFPQFGFSITLGSLTMGRAIQSRQINGRVYYAGELPTN